MENNTPAPVPVPKQPLKSGRMTFMDRLKGRKRLIMIIVGCLIAFGVILNIDARGKGRLFGLTCSLVGGKVETSGGPTGTWRDCVSKVLKTSDAGKSCQGDHDCQGACTGFFDDITPSLPAMFGGDPPVCTDGRRIFSSRPLGF
jgi:hypothetical protein